MPSPDFSVQAETLLALGQLGLNFMLVQGSIHWPQNFALPAVREHQLCRHGPILPWGILALLVVSSQPAPLPSSAGTWLGPRGQREAGRAGSRACGGARDNPLLVGGQRRWRSQQGGTGRVPRTVSHSGLVL